jgi:hypothetical protein
LSFTLPVVGSVTLGGTFQGIAEAGATNGNFATDGSQYARFQFSNRFTIEFSSQVVAVGFYLIDYGDTAGCTSASMTFDAQFQSRSTTSFTIPYDKTGNLDGGVFFVGLVDIQNGFDRIELNNNCDPAGLDQFIAFSASQLRQTS